MGEIKSTLDLVMEKTRNMSLSAEERKGQKDKEIGGRIRGLLNKFQDQAISFDRFNSEYRALKKDYGLKGTGNKQLIKAVCDRIEPGKDNQALFDLLAGFKVPDVERLTSVLQEFEAVRQTAARQRRRLLKEQLAKTHFISGSAVVPNLQNDSGWHKELVKIRAKYKRLLDEEKTGLMIE